VSDAVVSSVSVFLLAQNRLLREALAKVLSRKNDVEIVGSCAVSPNSVKEIMVAAPEVLVVDSFATSVAHLAFVREVQARVVGLKLVMIGMEPDEQQFLHAVREGALGYVLKDASAAEVVSAVRAVANGDGVCPPQFCAFLFRHVARERQLPNLQLRENLGLTNREQQLVWLISRGLTNKEIASQLQLAEQTVRNHVHRMLRKLGAPHRMAVVEMCRVQGLPV
jgi:DNA-binding NarL/FixJ family response regulator